MKIFFSNLIKFLIPFFLYIFFNLIINPSNVFFDNDKLENSKLDDNLIKLKKYTYNPKSLVFLGDSKIDLLVRSIQNDLTISNLAFGGSNIHEIVETFKFLTNIKNPDSLFIGINFHNFNSAYSHNRIKRLKEYVQSPYSYLISKDLLYKHLNNLYNYFQTKPQRLKPMGTKSWSSALGTFNSFFAYYIYPVEILDELLKIKKYCLYNNITLVFVIPPIHLDAIKKVEDYGLEAEYKSFKKFIYSLGKVYDFSNVNKFTKNRSYFNDPYHLKRVGYSHLFSEIMNDQSKFLINYLKF